MNYLLYDLIINLIYNNKYNFSLYVVITVIILLISITIIILITSYYLIKYLEINIVNDIYFCNYNYNKKSNEVLKKYGEYKIKKIYLVKNPITKYITLLLNLLTLYNYEKTLLNISELLKKKCIPYHISLILEIELLNKRTKFLLIEKTSYVNISENFSLNKQQTLKLVKLPKKVLTMNSILKETQNRIGEKKFFNWSLYKNNCSVFIKELFITIGIYNKSNIKFINHNKFGNYVKFSNLTLHIINILLTCNNILNNYFHI